MKKFVLILLLFPSVLVLGQINFKDPVVAKVGSINITESEFLQRYELNPLFRKSQKKISQSLKLEFLYSLIAEKIYAQYAKEKMLDTTDALIIANKEIEKIFVRDALYRKEISSKIFIDPKEVQASVKLNQSQYQIRFITSLDSLEIFNLFKLLKSGFPFDSLITHRPEYKEQKEVMSIGFGELQPLIEKEVFKLNNGQFTYPIPELDGWYIFYVYNKTISPLPSGKQYQEIINNVTKIIKERKNDELYKQFYVSFFKNKKVDVDAQLFKKLVSQLSKLLKQNSLQKVTSENSIITLDVGNIHKFELENKNSIDSVFIKIPESGISLKYFLRALIFHGFQTQKVDSVSIANLLNKKIRVFIEHELLYKEGIKQKLNLQPDVIQSIAMWKDYYLSQSVKSAIVESATVTDSLLLNYYNQLYKTGKYPAMINLVEILTESFDESLKMLNRIKKGEDIQDLAKKYSLRQSVKNNNGQTGFFPVYLNPEISKIAVNLKVNDIYGPVKVKEGYSLFKLIGKKEEVKIAPLKSFEEEKDRLKRMLASEQVNKQINNLTAKLADQYTVTINGKALQQVEVTNLNSFSIRLLGFGGKISAVPIIKPDVEWVDQWLKKKNL